MAFISSESVIIIIITDVQTFYILLAFMLDLTCWFGRYICTAGIDYNVKRHISDIHTMRWEIYSIHL